MSTLGYAILGLLHRRSMTGYELSKAFESGLFEVWSAKHSQIYPELKGLYEAGLIEYQVEISGTVLEKKVYTITPDGLRTLQNWVQAPCGALPVPKDEFRLRLFFADCISPTIRRQQLGSRLAQHRQRLEQLQAERCKFDQIPPREEQAFQDYLVLLGGIYREEAACRWLEQCLELCDQREQE